MATVKILLLSAAAVVGIGGTSAALTKDKWWPKGEQTTNMEEGNDGSKNTPSCEDESQNCKIGETESPNLNPGNA